MAVLETLLKTLWIPVWTPTEPKKVDQPDSRVMRGRWRVGLSRGASGGDPGTMEQPEPNDSCPHCAGRGYVEIAMATGDGVRTCRECEGSRRRQPGCDAPADIQLSYGMYCEARRKLTGV
jgi:hypothetical protein